MKTKILVTTALILLFTAGRAQDSQSNADQNSVKERTFQVSFVPGFGTSRGAKDGYTNKLSLNFFAGYEHSLNGFEWGGFYNVNKHNIRGVQLAGFGNTVGGYVRGAQFSGFINTVKGNVRGVQSAGFANITSGKNRGVQMAGFVNKTDSIKGIQLAGSVNLADSVNGTQLSGLGNITSKGLKGAQVSGLFNVAEDVSGFQLAGLFNKGRRINGTQLALINIADTVERGAVIGLVNVVKHGKHQLALESNDVMDVNLTFRSGTDKLYSILFAGIEAKSDFLWSYGVGFGTQFKLKNQWNSAVELTTQTINPRGDHQEDLNLLNRFSWNFGYQLADHLTISAGPVLNVYVTKVYDTESGQYGNDIYNDTFYNETFSDTNIKMWVGYNFSIKF